MPRKGDTRKAHTFRAVGPRQLPIHEHSAVQLWIYVKELALKLILEDGKASEKAACTNANHLICAIQLLSCPD
jgi:hypothetical protein